MDDEKKKPDKSTIIVHSGNMDKIYSALIVSNGALSMGMEASLFFTFWGLQHLQMGGLEKGPLSKMHFLGIGKSMIKGRMKKANVSSLERLMNDYRELDGKVKACEMTMEIMGIDKKDFNQDIIDEYGAVGTYVNEARDSKITLFI